MALSPTSTRIFDGSVRCSSEQFESDGRDVVLNPLGIVSVAFEQLGERIGSVKEEGDRVVAAIDLLLSQAWD
jgi:hypothetical protein